MLNYIRENIQESIIAKEKLLRDEALIGAIEQVARVCIGAYLRGNKLLICGNGGSASDALHMAGELVGRYQMERRGIAAIVLNANQTVMTAIANDYEYENIFSKQVAALGKEGDVLIGISTSGNSANVINALQEAKNKYTHDWTDWFYRWKDKVNGGLPAECSFGEYAEDSGNAYFINSYALWIDRKRAAGTGILDGGF